MTLDLFEVTETLINLVKKQWNTAPLWEQLGGPPAFTPNFTGLAPDAAKQQGGPQLSMYLYHVESDNALQSLSWQPWMPDATPGEPIRYQPLPLDLYYLLFAFSDTDTGFTQEQQAMSVAMRIYHAHGILRSDPAVPVPWELTLTMEHRSYDELSRLWQATTAPLRMSVVYRAAVVLIDPDPQPKDATLIPTKRFSVSADPVPPPVPQPGPVGAVGDPVVFGTFTEGSYTGPDGQPVPFKLSNVALVPGRPAWLLGAFLGEAGVSDRVYLLTADGATETDVTSWTDQPLASEARFVLTPPAAVGAAPAGTPPPGVYQLRVGSGTLGSAGAVRSGSIPVGVAAYVDPAAGPVLAGSPPYTVTGAGFTAGATEVLVGTSPLQVVSSGPMAGQVSIDPSGTSLSFAPPVPAPASPAGAFLPVRVRVSGIESPPALWVTP